MASLPPAANVGHINDVQELWKSNSIPQRFVRDLDEQPTPAKVVTLCPSSEVPVVDLSKLTNGSASEFRNEMLKLAEACEEWGFFQVHIYYEIVLTSLET